jgi:glycerophosphoryl diester phosphodiesterase
MGMTPIIVAHRGLHQMHPENSLAAFQSAWDAGIIWCECDVHFSADGIACVLHDETLDRTTSAKGRIDRLTQAELERVRLENGESIPTLSSIAAAMPALAGLLVELKSPAGGDQARHILQIMRNRRWMFQSFDRHDVESASGLLPGVATALLVDKEHLAGAENCRCDAVYAEYTGLDEAIVARLKNAGKRVGAWTVNNEQNIRNMARLELEMIITDEPILAARIVGEEIRTA